MKSIRLPDNFEYPIQIEFCFVEVGQIALKGDEVVRVRNRNGGSIAIKAPCTGRVMQLDIRTQEIVDQSRIAMTIDDEGAISQTEIQKSKALLATKREAFLRTQESHERANVPKREQPQSRVQRTEATMRKAESPRKTEKPQPRIQPSPTTDQKPTGRVLLWLLWLILLGVLFKVGFPMTAAGSVFWEHLGLLVGAGFVPLLLGSWFIRRRNLRRTGRKQPHAMVIVAMIAGLYGMTLFTVQNDESKRSLEARAAGIPVLSLVFPAPQCPELTGVYQCVASNAMMDDHRYQLHIVQDGITISSSVDGATPIVSVADGRRYQVRPDQDRVFGADTCEDNAFVTRMSGIMVGNNLPDFEIFNESITTIEGATLTLRTTNTVYGRQDLTLETVTVCERQ